VLRFKRGDHATGPAEANRSGRVVNVSMACEKCQLMHWAPQSGGPWRGNRPPSRQLLAVLH
jgi:hypothetical protein